MMDYEPRTWLSLWTDGCHSAAAPNCVKASSEQLYSCVDANLSSWWKTPVLSVCPCVYQCLKVHVT